MDISNFLNQIKVPGIFRDILYFISGFLILLIINFLYKPDINSYPNLNYFNDYTTIVDI